MAGSEKSRLNVKVRMRERTIRHAKSSEIRGSFFYTVAGRLMGYVLWMLSCTLRYRLLDHGKREEKGNSAIYCIWHNRILCAPFFWLQYAPEKKMTFLTSSSKDGSLVQEALSIFGMEGARGSSSRRGVGAMVKMVHYLKDNNSLAMTPDGPKGPLYKIKPGVIKIAIYANRPIIPIRIEYSNCWRIKNWDGFCIPKPFSKVFIDKGEPWHIPSTLTESEINDYSLELERKMQGGLPDFESINSNH